MKALEERLGLKKSTSTNSTGNVPAAATAASEQPTAAAAAAAAAHQAALNNAGVKDKLSSLLQNAERRIGCGWSATVGGAPCRCLL